MIRGVSASLKNFLIQVLLSAWTKNFRRNYSVNLPSSWLLPRRSQAARNVLAHHMPLVARTICKTHRRKEIRWIFPWMTRREPAAFPEMERDARQLAASANGVRDCLLRRVLTMGRCGGVCMGSDRGDRDSCDHTDSQDLGFSTECKKWRIAAWRDRCSIRRCTYRSVEQVPLRFYSAWRQISLFFSSMSLS